MKANQISQIAEGWYNVVRDALGVLPDKIKTLAEDRLKICEPCPQRKNSKCNVCGCELIAKVKSTKAICPIKKW